MKNYTEEIQLLTQLSSEAAQAAIAEYTRYYIVSSIWWAFFCTAGIAASAWLWKLSTKALEDERDDTVLFGARACIVLVIAAFALAFADNVSDLISPRAMAIHQLLRDIRRE